MLKDSYKMKTLNGVYRTVHPLDTYKIAKKAIQKKYPRFDVRYHIDNDKYDFGLSALYPRGVLLTNKNQPIYRSATWGKGVFPIASAVSCMMEMLEGIAMKTYISENINNKILKFLMSIPDVAFKSEYKKLVKFFKLIDLDDQYTFIHRLDVENNCFHKIDISLAAFFFTIANRYNMSNNALDLVMGIHGCTSWGSGAGNNLEEALIHSLMEIVERISKDTIISQERIAPEIDQSTIDNKLINQLIENLYAAGLDGFKFSDWSTGLGIPAVALTYRYDGRHYHKLGTGTTREEAFQRAITEFIQTLGPQRMANIGKSVNLISELESSDRINIGSKISYSDIQDIDNDNIKIEIETIVKKLEDAGLYTYFLNTWTNTIDIPAVHTFVFNEKFDKINLDTGIFS